MRQEVNRRVTQLQKLLVVGQKQRLPRVPTREARQNLRLLLGQFFLFLQELCNLRLFHRPRLQHNTPAQHRWQKTDQSIRDQNDHCVFRRFLQCFEQGVLRLHSQLLGVRNQVNLVRTGIRLDLQIRAHAADLLHADAVLGMRDRNNIGLVAALGLHTRNTFPAGLEQPGLRAHGRRLFCAFASRFICAVCRRSLCSAGSHSGRAPARAARRRALFNRLHFQIIALKRHRINIGDSLAAGTRVAAQNVGMRNTARSQGIIEVLDDRLLADNIRKLLHCLTSFPIDIFDLCGALPQ